MRATTAENALRAANPVPAGALDGARIADAEAELLDTIEWCSPLDSPPPARRPLRGAPRRGGRARRRLLATGAVAAAVAASLLVTLDGGGSHPGDAVAAYPPVLVRYAANSPLVLLGLAHWHVSYVFESSAREGEMQFLPAGASPRELLRQAQLTWQPRPWHYWPGGTTGQPLGDRARVFRDGSGRHGTTFLAEWRYRGLSVSFRATTGSLAGFDRMLAALRPVDERTWLAALPPSVIRAAERPSEVSRMLAGIPLPPGFRASQIPDAGLTEARYQLGAAVAGTVACRWFAIWAQARLDGDATRARAAVAAMATSPRWPVLRAMRGEGGYPQVLEEYAADMPSGRWHGHSLAQAVTTGLGCPEHGVKIPTIAHPAGRDIAPSVQSQGGAGARQSRGEHRDGARR
ncbi:MAG TPA: hypothetical protein VMU32_09905 [Solirubrobacteraceae bacterium]|nr:hypothetical protein [Solirubrobacteraceae bacterium]